MSNVNNKSNKKPIVFWLALLIIVLIIGACFNLFGKKKEETSTESNNKNQEEIKNLKERETDKELFVYITDNNYILVTEEEQTSSKYNLVYTYECYTDSCAYEEDDMKKYVLVSDDKIYYLIDLDNKDKESIASKLNDEKISFVSKSINEEEQSVGIIIAYYNRSRYYDILNNNITIDQKGYIDISNSEIYFDKNYLPVIFGYKNEESVEYTCTSALYNITNGSEVNNSRFMGYYSYQYNENQKPVLIKKCNGEDFVLLNSSFKKVSNKFYNRIYELSKDKEYALMNIKEKTYDIYNEEEDKIATYNSTYPILKIFKDYIIGLNNNHVIILDRITNEILGEYEDLDFSKYEFDEVMTDIYGSHDGKNAGLYILYKYYPNSEAVPECYELYFDLENKVFKEYNLKVCSA